MKKFIDDKNLLIGAMYAPFCRTLPPPEDEWDRDIATMKELGYNCLHGFCEWHQVEYEKGKYDFSKIDSVVESAYNKGVKAIVNIATQNSFGFYSPRWLMEEYSGKGFVDSEGGYNREGQFSVPCLDDPWYLAYAYKYIAAVGKHFAGDERVAGFVLWGEPMLYRARAEGYSPICFCEHTLRRFKDWLKKKYGSIDKLNESWGTEGPSAFGDFDKVRPPRGTGRQLGGYCSWQDFKGFMDDNFYSHIKNADEILKNSGAVQPTIVEISFNLVSAGVIDQWKIATAADIVGVSSFRRPDKSGIISMVMGDSAAKMSGRSLFVVEAQGGTRIHTNPVSPSVEELKTELNMMLGHNAKGLMYWCWRPRLSDTEGGEFGLCRADGKPLGKCVEIGQHAEKLYNFSAAYQNSERICDVAVYSSMKINNLLHADFTAETYADSFLGAANMLGDMQVQWDIINEEHIVAGRLSGYKVLVLPYAFMLDEPTARGITEFVKAGGTVISDCLLAVKNDNGICYTDTPGGGLNSLFGLTRDDTLYIDDESMVQENLFGICVGTKIDIVQLHGAKEFAAYNAMPIITENTFGKGKAYYFSYDIFRQYTFKNQLRLRELLTPILEKAGVKRICGFLEQDTLDEVKIRTSLLSEKGKAKIITVVNTGYGEYSDTLILEDGEYVRLSDGKKTDGRIGFTLPSWGSEVYIKIG